MLCTEIQGKWVESFVELFHLCGVKKGTVAAVLSETQSRAINLRLCELALDRLGACWSHLRVPSKKQQGFIPIRSTGASDALVGNEIAAEALSSAEIIVDCSVEGLLHAVELKAALSRGARLIMISNEHPDVLERIGHFPELEGMVLEARSRLAAASVMRVESAYGTSLSIDVRGAAIGGNWGYCTQPGTRAHWPGGLVACSPKARSVSGTVVLAPADANLTFKRYIESPVHLQIQDDYVTSIEGTGVDAELMRSYLAAWEEPEAYAVSHVGWGLNPHARWEALAMYDRADINGTELRVFQGNFLFSTGANEHAGRYTRGHFDIPMRGCSVYLDDHAVVINGQLCG